MVVRAGGAPGDLAALRALPLAGAHGTIPLSDVATVSHSGMLLLTATPLGVPALIGMLMLVGIVVTNAIVLIDLVNQYRRDGRELLDAVVVGAAQRPWPILMTAPPITARTAATTAELLAPAPPPFRAGGRLMV